MAFVSKFDTQTVRPWNQPQLDTYAQINFPLPFLLAPHLPQGLSELDISRDGDIRVMSSINNVNRSSGVYHVTGLGNTTVYSGVVQSLDIPSLQCDFKNGEWTRNLTANPNAPASTRIDFGGSPFPTPPEVVVFLNHLEFDNNHNWRINTSATNIDQTGFTLTVDKWSDTQLYTATAGWIAYPANRAGIFSTKVDTQSVRPWNQPQLNNSQAITFGGAKFQKTPEVFVAFSGMDINSTRNLRLSATVTNVTQQGLTWHLDSWFDTILYSAQASIIAIDALD